MDREDIRETIYFNEAAKNYFNKVNEMKDFQLVPEKHYKKTFNDILMKNVCSKGITQEVYSENLKADKSLCNLISELLKWFFMEKNNDIGGFLICSAPGVGKTQVMRALSSISHLFRQPKYKTQGIIKYISFDAEISAHLKSKESTTDFTFHILENIILDDLSEKMNDLKTYSFEHSLNNFFKSRYEIWQNHGYKTIITTNMIPDLGNSMEGSMETIYKNLDTKTLERVKQQYKVFELTGKSKRLLSN